MCHDSNPRLTVTGTSSPLWTRDNSLSLPQKHNKSKQRKPTKTIRRYISQKRSLEVKTKHPQHPILSTKASNPRIPTKLVHAPDYDKRNP